MKDIQMKLLSGDGTRLLTASAVCCHQLSINEMTGKCIPTCSINPSCSVRSSMTSLGWRGWNTLLTHDDWLPRWFSLEIVDMSQALLQSDTHPVIQPLDHPTIRPFNHSYPSLRGNGVIKTEEERVGKVERQATWQDAMQMLQLRLGFLTKFSDLFCTWFRHNIICQRSWNIWKTAN